MHNAPPPARAFALAALLLACGLLSLSGFELKWVTGAGFHKQPGFWSVMALAGMAVFALLALLQKTEVTQRKTPRHWLQPARQWLGPTEYALYFLLYVYAVPRLGYLPATLLGFSLLVLRLGYRSLKMLSYAWLVGIIIVVLFKSLLQVKIPGGALYEIFPAAVRNFLTLHF